MAAGTISSTYLDYFSGIVEKLPYGTNYVIWKSEDYEYTLAYGQDLVLEGSNISGSDCSVVRIYRETDTYNANWLVGYGSEDIQVDAGSLFIYSDLGMYPTVERGLNSYEGAAFLFAVVFATLYIVLRDFFRTLF